MLDVAARIVGRHGRVLDLACGRGSLAVRATERFLDAEVVAADLDPVLLELGRAAFGTAPSTTTRCAPMATAHGWPS